MKRATAPLAQALAKSIDDDKTLIFLITEKTIRAKNNNGDTPLHVALSQKRAQAGVIRLLLSQGADLTEQNNQGNTPIHLAMRDSSSTILNLMLANKKKDEVAQLVILQSACLSTPLHAAIDCFLAKKETAKLATIDTLLSNGADLAACNNAGNTPIHCAALGDASGALLVALLKHVTKEEDQVNLVNIKNKQGATALHLAIEKCLEDELETMENISVLLIAGADLEEPNNEKITPLDLIKAASGMPHAQSLLEFIEKCVFTDETKKEESWFTKFKNLLTD